MNQSPNIESVLALMNRYDRPGPRYTSYPTAPNWDPAFDSSDFRAALATRDRSRPLSLYVHIPFCEKRCLYCGCNAVISPHHHVALPYLDALDLEIDRLADQVGADSPVVQLHLGGGTPTYLDGPQLESLIHHLRRRFPWPAEAELSIEVDPAVTGVHHLGALRGLGFDRISLGIQDLDPTVQKAVRREQPARDLRGFYDQCREHGFASINVDLIYGLPHQTKESFALTAREIATEWRPDRLALFSYAHVPRLKPHQRLLPQEALPHGEDKLRIFLAARRILLEAGYDAIGMDHFARPDDELSRARRTGSLRRNFMGYTTCPESDVLALGTSSISEVDGCYAQNHRRLARYQGAIAAGGLATARGLRLSDDDRLRRDVIMELMCNATLDCRRIEATHGISLAREFAPELRALRPLVEDGLVTVDPARIQVTPLGQLLVRNVAMVFDSYLKLNAARDLTFSRTV